ncbi:MAG: rhodanese-like domain-containing protein [Pseudomonadota bacterium]
MKSYDQLVSDALTRVCEIQPWDLKALLESNAPLLLLDVREPTEYAALHIPGSVNVPRGVLEQSCEWDYDETVPELAARCDRKVVVICRSGKRSALAADAMLQLGYEDVVSLKTGVRGWNDFDQPLVDGEGCFVDGDAAEAMLAPGVRPEQRRS